MVGKHEELVSLLDRYGFAGAFMFCLDEHDRDPAFTVPNNRTLAHAKSSEGKLLPFVRLDLTTSRSRRPAAVSISAHAGSSSIRARRRSPSGRAPAADLALAVERDVPILIHGGRGLPPIAEDLETLVKRNEGVRLIVAHAGIADMAALAGRLGGIPGVFFDTSVWSGLDLLDLYRQVAPEQVMYASDYPYGRQPNSLLVSVRTAKLAGFDDKQLRLMLGGSVRRMIDGEENVRRPRRVVRPHACQLELVQHVDDLVADGLEGRDRPVELHAHLGVLDASPRAASHAPTSSAASITDASSTTRRQIAVWSPSGPTGTARRSSSTRRAALRVGSIVGTASPRGASSRNEPSPLRCGRRRSPSRPCGRRARAASDR